MFDNVDNLALAFFTSLVACSILSDSYIVANNFLKNNYIKKRLSYIKKIYKVINAVVRNNYKKDNNGNIVFDEVKIDSEEVELIPEEEENKVSTNPFDQEIQKETKIDSENINSTKNITNSMPLNTSNNTTNNTSNISLNKNNINVNDNHLKGESITSVESDSSVLKSDKSKKKNKTVIKEIILKKPSKKK